MSLNSGQKLKKILTAFLVCGTFLFVFASKNVLAVNDYQKISSGTLTSGEWNNLTSDFVNTWLPARMNGPLGINTIIPPTTPIFLEVGGDLKANSGLFSGNVGIGTINPGAKLDIANALSDTPSSSNQSMMFQSSGNSADYYGIMLDNSSRLKFTPRNGGTWSPTALTLDQSGNVGIGTTAPGFKLTVNGGTGDSLDMLGGYIHGLNSTPTVADQAVPLGYLQNNYLSNTTASSTSYWSGAKNGTIWNGDAGVGNVGIGTTNPTAPLSVIADSLTTGVGLLVSSASTAGGASGSSYLLKLDRSGMNANNAHIAYGIYSTVTDGTTGTNKNIAGYFSAAGGTGTTNYAAIFDAGYVGIVATYLKYKTRFYVFFY